jgi:hypothetical protein
MMQHAARAANRIALFSIFFFLSVPFNSQLFLSSANLHPSVYPPLSKGDLVLAQLLFSMPQKTIPSPLMGEGMVFFSPYFVKRLFPIRLLI